MLFNSYEFILIFLPLTLIGFYFLGHKGYITTAIAWLVAASLLFYGWWNPAYLGLLLFSMSFNYGVGKLLTHTAKGRPFGKLLLLGSIAVNLALIGYYKYANFFAQNINSVFGSNFNFEHIILPLAISFFTFQQIAYLIDAYQSETQSHNFLSYCLFVCFFPQLIAGPIVHHREVMHQFADRLTYRFHSENLAVGLTMFSAGLFKKVVFADTAAVIATPIFDAAAGGKPISLIAAWCGALAYTCQLYFDFSGYSDMAIGASRMFGVRLPLNFNSPYKAQNISEFWRRWHITLSRFLRDYLYIPLGGNRKGEFRRQLNLMVTMLLGGLWHGAGWTFVLWGGLHGLYLVLHRQWTLLQRQLGFKTEQPSWLRQGLSCLLTFLAVVVAWVLFRAESLSAAGRVLQAMLGLGSNKLSLTLGLSILDVLWIGLLLLIIWVTPNTQEWLAHYRPALDAEEEPSTPPRWAPLASRWQWHPSQFWAWISAGMVLIPLLLLSQESEFIYFNF